MAYSVTDRKYLYRKNGKAIYRIEAVLDSADDLEALGTGYAPGSTAMVADSSCQVFMVNASGEWEVLA